MRGGGSRAAQLWIGLARAALAAEATDEKLDDAQSTDPVVVAKAIDEHKKDAAYDQVVVGYLLQIAEELKTKGGKEAAALQKRISRLVGTLQPQTLARLLEMGGDSRQRKKFVIDAAQGMAVDAVVELVQAAANTSGQNISHSLVRMLSKLAVHADEGSAMTRTNADGALRDQVQQLISGWQLDDPNPDGYRLALDKMSRAAPVFRQSDDALPCEPERLLQMGIEIQILGEPVWRSRRHARVARRPRCRCSTCSTRRPKAGCATRSGGTSRRPTGCISSSRREPVNTRGRAAPRGAHGACGRRAAARRARDGRRSHGVGVRRHARRRSAPMSGRSSRRESPARAGACSGCCS